MKASIIRRLHKINLSEYLLKYSYLIFIVISSIITSYWFRKGYLFATAEQGMQFYSLERTTDIYESTWIRWGTGYVYSDGLPMSLTTRILSLLEGVFGDIQIQFLMFNLLIFGAMYGAYLITNKLTSNYKISFFSGIFYFFNLYCMSQVWRRSLYAGMFAWAYIPLYTYLLLRWLEEKRIRLLIVLLLSSLIYLWMFSNPGYVFLLLGVTFCLVIFY